MLNDFKQITERLKRIQLSCSALSLSSITSAMTMQDLEILAAMCKEGINQYMRKLTEISGQYLQAFINIGTHWYPYLQKKKS